METKRPSRALFALAVILNARGIFAADEVLKVGPRELRVTVYLILDNCRPPALVRAQQTTVRLFADIGVAVVFRDGAQPKAQERSALSVELQLHERTPAPSRSTAMGYCRPFAYAGTPIHIHCDRAANPSLDGGSGALLGYVMAHEIGHVLGRVNRHAEEGVMKARWGTADIRQMVSGMLRFGQTDGELIHAALEAHSLETHSLETH